MMNQNKRRLIQNTILLMVTIALAIFVWNKNNQPKALSSTLYDESIGDEASEIRIFKEGRKDITLKLVKGLWRVTAPDEFEANSEKVRHLFTLLSENADNNYPTQGKDLAQYGLEKERLSVSFNGVKIVFGKLNEVSMQRYILKGDTMYLISETVSGLLEQGLEAFKRPPASLENESASET